MTDLAVRFREWDRGHAGVVDPALADKGKWHGSNVQTYPSGLIGPRWGLRKLTVSGVNVVPSAGGPAGLAAIGAYLYVVTDKAYRVPLADLLADGTAAAEPFAAYSSTPASWVPWVAEDSGVVYSLSGGTLYRHSGLGTASVATPSTFSHIRRWDLYCVAIDANVPYRLWFSRVDDTGWSFADWPADNYQDIGDAEPITAIVPLHGSLMVGKRTGWWALSGAITDPPYVRQVFSGNGPTDPRGTAPTHDRRIAYWPADDAPATFDGANVGLLRDHRAGTSYTPTGAQAVAVSAGGETTLWGYDEDSLSNVITQQPGAGVTRHAFGKRLVGWASDAWAITPGYVLAAKQAATAGEDLTLYAWRVDPDRPARDDDTLGQPGDDSDIPIDADLATSAWWDPQGRQVQVRSVIVQLRRWPGTWARNRLVVSVETFGVADRGDTESLPQPWLVDSADAAVDGTNTSIRLGFDCPPGNGFRIHLRGLVGVAIREVVAEVSYRSSRT